MISYRESWVRDSRQALCADSSLPADEWFPLSAEVHSARAEAAAAIAICQACPVRTQCLALSLRHWEIGQHGVWGGLVAGERAMLLRRRKLAYRDSPRKRSGPGRALKGGGPLSSPAGAS